MMNCKIQKQCGGCQYVNEGYDYALNQKNEVMRKLFADFQVTVHPIAGMENPYSYRNKTIVAFDKNYQYGLYEENSHRIIPYDHCLLHDEETDHIIKKIAQLFKKYHVSLYDPQRKRGDIRHVQIRRSVKTNQTMVTLVSSAPVFEGSKNFCKILTHAFPSIQTIVLNINKRETSIVLGEQEKILYGKGYIVDELCGLTFKISSRSFYQINHEQCVALYNKALSLLPLDEHASIIDTYCGIGTIGMIASQKAGHVIGVEKNSEAIADAKNNKMMNHLSNIQFINDDATDYMAKAAQDMMNVSAVIMDPPRSGSTEHFIQSVKKLAPKHVLYISCDPTTQVRDLKWFKEAGYTFTDVYPYDMFPFTQAIESIVLLKKG